MFDVLLALNVAESLRVFVRGRRVLEARVADSFRGVIGVCAVRELRDAKRALSAFLEAA